MNFEYSVNGLVQQPTKSIAESTDNSQANQGKQWIQDLELLKDRLNGFLSLAVLQESPPLETITMESPMESPMESKKRPCSTLDS